MYLRSRLVPKCERKCRRRKRSVVITKMSKLAIGNWGHSVEATIDYRQERHLSFQNFSDRNCWENDGIHCLSEKFSLCFARPLWIDTAAAKRKFTVLRRNVGENCLDET